MQYKKKNTTTCVQNSVVYRGAVNQRNWYVALLRMRTSGLPGTWSCKCWQSYAVLAEKFRKYVSETLTIVICQ